MTVGDALEAGDPRRAGQYRIVARLGAGGMGRVYLGRSPAGRAVAVKVVRPELAEDEQFRRRFAREVAAARRVNGVFTAGVLDADPEGRPPWLATAYVPGLSLAGAVGAYGPWPAGPVLALGAGLAEALGAIHGAGVVHRDLKPGNVLLSADGPRVIDFGISVAADVSALTRTGFAIGTPGFMAPEQVLAGAVGPAADVFSLGAVLAWTATGTGPFGIGSAHAVNFRAVYEDPDVTAVPAVLREVVLDCLAREPERRPGVAELLERLTAASGATPDPLAVPEQWLPAPVARAVRAGAAGAAGAGHARTLEGEAVEAVVGGAAGGPHGPADRRRAEPATEPAAEGVAEHVAEPVVGVRSGERSRPAGQRPAWLRRAAIGGSALASVAALAVSVVVYLAGQDEEPGGGRRSGAQGPSATTSVAAPTTRPATPSAGVTPAKTAGGDLPGVPVTTFKDGPLRSSPSRDSQRLGTVRAGRHEVFCRTRGATVTENGVYNSWWLWTEVDGTRGWVSAYYLNGDDQALAADGSVLPDCPDLSPRTR
ncbi:serine/threonine protein kinase [Streptomyces sp. NPDC101118]|uniref:serine/threonine protein kinase n=1 Tax=Streptomyces sp. NPDC101118 TaxID=3366109 RepID=UPI0037F5E6E0